MSSPNLPSAVANAAPLTPIALQSTNYTAGANQLVPVDATNGATTITLPAGAADKTRVIVKKIDSSVNAVAIHTSGSDVFNQTGGSVSVSLSLQNQSLSVQYTASTGIWYVTSNDLPLSALDSRYSTPSSVSSAISTLQNSVTTTINGTVSGAQLSGRSLQFTTIGGSTINAGTVVPNLTLSGVTQLPYNGTAAASIGGTATDPTLALSLPQGTPGDLTAITSSSGTTLTITTFPSTYILTMTGNVTSITLPSPSASVAGTISLTLIQDVTGGHTVTWPSAVKWSEGVVGAPSTGANAVSIFNLFWNNSVWYGYKAGQNFA